MSQSFDSLRCNGAAKVIPLGCFSSLAELIDWSIFIVYSQEATVSFFFEGIVFTHLKVAHIPSFSIGDWQLTFSH